MKRSLLVLVLAVACLALLAAPAFAQGTAFVPLRAELWGGYYWFDGETGDAHDATADAIPADYDVYLQLGYVSPTRGQVQNVPDTWLYDFKLYHDDGATPFWSSDMTQSRLLWEPLSNEGLGWAFNKENATIWRRMLTKTFSGLAAGSYSGITTEIVTHPVNDLSYYDPLELGYWAKHAQQKPVKIPAGTNNYTFFFMVAP